MQSPRNLPNRWHAFLALIRDRLHAPFSAKEAISSLRCRIALTRPLVDPSKARIALA